MKSFASDNYASVHPRILESLTNANAGHAVAYGGDGWTEKLNDRIKEIFGVNAQAFPVFNGTGANITALGALLKPYEAVICATGAHINVDECGAAERILGTKLLDVECPHGKLTPELIRPFTLNFGNEHQAQGKVISLTQSTELGTLYQLAELEAIKTFAKDRGMKIFVDGARFANAVAALGVSPRKIAEATGADIITVGGTKNGLLAGELIVVLNPALAEEMKYYRKQSMQLASKMRYLSVQFCEYFEKDLWIENATQANQMAALLAKKLEGINQVCITQPVEVNGIFARVPPELIAPLQKEYPFYIWNELTHEVRWMCSFDTTTEDIEKFVNKIKSLLQ